LIARFVILEACSLAAPLVLVPGPWDKDWHEIEDPYDLALPDAAKTGQHAVPARESQSDLDAEL
jgi:hypothetical protein